MSRLIDENDIIKMLNTMDRYTSEELTLCDTDKTFPMNEVFIVDDVFEGLDELPSAQPERLTDDDFETIRIHLNAYKEKLCNQHRWEEADEYQRIIDRFMAFASAQPDSKELSPTHKALDTISRQAAISHVGDVPYIKDHPNVGLLWKAWIESLPSAQPEIVQCEDCQHWEQETINDGYCTEMDLRMCDADFYCGYAERRTDDC